MFRPARIALALAVPVLFAGTAFADVAAPPDAPPAVTPAPVAAPAPPAGNAPAPGASAAEEAVVPPVTAPPAPAPAASSAPARSAPGPVPAPAPTPESPAPGIVRSGTAEQGCFPGKEEYLDVWHATGVAPDPCFVPPALSDAAPLPL